MMSLTIRYFFLMLPIVLAHLSLSSMSAIASEDNDAPLAVDGGMKAFVTKGFNPCDRTAYIEFHANNKEAFADQNLQGVENLVIRTASAISSRCGEAAKRMRIVGIVDDTPETAFTSRINRFQEWKLFKSGVSIADKRRLAHFDKLQEQNKIEEKRKEIIREQASALERLTGPASSSDAYDTLDKTDSPQSGGESWRFKLTCGRMEYMGFMTLGLSGNTAEALFEAMTGYPRIAMLMTQGTFNPANKSFVLKGAGFVPSVPQFGPYEFNAALDKTGDKMSGSAKGAEQCSDFTAWKAALDTRRNASGLVAKRASGASTTQELMRIKADHIYTSEACEKFIEWYASATVIKTPDGNVSSALVDNNRMLEVLGFTYDSMNDVDSRAFTMVTNGCVKLLQQSADIKHAALLNQYKKSQSLGADVSPYLIGHHGGRMRGVGRSARLNYHWYQNMYVATAVRAARDSLERRIEFIKAQPAGLDRLNAISGFLAASRSGAGDFAYVSQDLIKDDIEELHSLRDESAKHAINAELASLDVADYPATIDGLQALRARQSEIKSSIVGALPASRVGELEARFEKQLKPISRRVTDDLIAAFPGVEVSLAGLRGYENKRAKFYDPYQSVLLAGDRTRLSKHIENSFSSALEQSSGRFSGWLEKDVPADEKGLVMLDSISSDLLGVPVSSLDNSRYPANMKFIVDAIQARYDQIKTEECIVPEGFEGMKDVVCPES